MLIQSCHKSRAPVFRKLNNVYKYIYLYIDMQSLTFFDKVCHFRSARRWLLLPSAYMLSTPLTEPIPRRPRTTRRCPCFVCRVCRATRMLPSPLQYLRKCPRSIGVRSWDPHNGGTPCPPPHGHVSPFRRGMPSQTPATRDFVHAPLQRGDGLV